MIISKLYFDHFTFRRFWIIAAGVCWWRGVYRIIIGLGVSWPTWWINNDVRWIAVPLRVIELLMGFYKVINGKVILALERPCATSDDLLIFDHRIDGAHRNDVARILGVHSS